jgi:hypothetical protein
MTGGGAAVGPAPVGSVISSQPSGPHSRSSSVLRLVSFATPHSSSCLLSQQVLPCSPSACFTPSCQPHPTHRSLPCCSTPASQPRPTPRTPPAACRIILENSGVAEPQNIRDQFNDAIADGHPITKRVFLDSLVTGALRCAALRCATLSHVVPRVAVLCHAATAVLWPLASPTPPRLLKFLSHLPILP